jgi:uncharacterized protein (TIGR02246 family)
MTIAIPDDIEGLLTRLREAWDATDAASFASCFTDDASYIIWRGDLIRGRAAIERAHAELFARAPGKTIIDVVDFRYLGADAGVLVTLGGTGTGDIVSDKLQTFVVTRQGDEWKVAAFHNTTIAT